MAEETDDADDFTKSLRELVEETVMFDDGTLDLNKIKSVVKTMRTASDKLVEAAKGAVEGQRAALDAEMEALKELT
jgi:hypothetical protein